MSFLPGHPSKSRAPKNDEPAADDPLSPAAGTSPAADEIDFTRFEGIGVPARVAWLASAVMYGSASVTFLALSLGTDLVPAIIAPISLGGLLMAVFCVIGAKRFTEASWGGHFRSITGMLIVTIGAVVIGDVHGATGMVMIYPMLVTAYLYDARRSVPYATFGTFWLVATFIVLIPDPTAHALAAGAIVGGICVVVIRSQQELRTIVTVNRDLSVTDALTGAANVRRLNEVLATTLRELSEESRVALFGMDLDDFKQVNDEFSHTRGDEVLRAVAQEIADAIGDGDLLARRGGDEFAVLVVDGGERDLFELQGRIKEAVRCARERVCPEVNTNGSVSFVMHVRGESVECLLERCDAALHEAKLEAHPERRVAENAVLSIRGARGVDTDASTRADHRVSGTTTAISEELKVARTIQHALGTASSWNVISIMSFASALAVMGALATKTGAELSGSLPLIAAIGLAALGGLAMAGAGAELPEKVMHAPLAAMTGLIAIAVWSSGPLTHSLADAYLAPAICAVYVLTSRALLLYLAAGLALFAATNFTGGYEYAIARMSVSGVITLVLIGMLLKARRVTREFTAHAVKLSTVDPLTGIANLRGMRRGVADAIDRCGRTKEILALVSVDLDEFKLVNDLHSHTMGDKVLVGVAEAMTGTVRPSDLVARRGGDEFAIVCIIDDENELPPLRLRLGEAIRGARSALTPDITPSASIGYVVWRRDEDADSFLARADEELHGAKLESRSGRESVRDLRSA